MVKTNIQTFTGEVEILSNLHLGDGSYYLTANADASNVVEVTGNVGATFFVGDGGFLSNIATTLSDIVDQGNVVSNVVQFSSDAGVSDYKGVGLVTNSNVGIQNTSPDHTLSIADIVVFDKEVSEPSASMNVYGKVYATRFEGDGGLLSNIATTLQSIVDQGNVSANVVQFNSATGYAGAGIITRSNVGIQNTAPVFNLSVGSNLHVDDEGSNVLVVDGNVAASHLNLGAFTVSPSHGLDQVCAESNLVTRPVRFSNVITAISAVSNIESAGTFISTDAERGIDVASNIDIGGRLKFDSNVFIDTLRVADVASNIVTYDRATGELTDSSGTFMNKFAVVSEQPPSDFFANTTTVTNHGAYTLTTSNLATDSNTYNAFDGTANAWVSGGLAGGYIDGSNVFETDNLTQLSNLHPTQFGDWLAIEFPYKTTLRHMKLTPLSVAQFPASANLYATNNDIVWSEIKYWEDVVPASDTTVQTITVDATEQFKKYALVVTKAAGNSSNVAIQDWQLFTESFSIDGGKVAMAQQATTGGETVMDQSGPHTRSGTDSKKYPEITFEDGTFEFNDSTNTYIQDGYTVTSSSQEFGLLVSKGLTGDQGYELLTGAQDLTNADGSYGIKGMQSTDHGANTPRGRNAVIASGHNPKSPAGTLTPTGTRFFWADLGNDIFDEWGMWYIFNPADQTASHIQFGTLNGGNGTVYTEIQTHHSKTFTIKHGWLVQGIFKLDVECSDADFQFTIGMYGEMGSDHTTTNEDKRYNASFGPLNYNFNRTNSGGALNTDPFYTYLIPKLKSYNDAITLSGTNFTSGVTTFPSTSAGSDTLAMWFDTLKVGATMYFVKGASGNITTSHMNEWIENDIAYQHAPWKAFDNITVENNVRPEAADISNIRLSLRGPIVNGWSSKYGTYYDGTANFYTGTTHQLGTGTAYGEWLKLKLPHKIKVTKFTLYADDINKAPKSYKIYGSETGSSWTELKSVTYEAPSVYGNSHDVNDTTGYKYVAIVVTQLNSDQPNVRIGELRVYGSEIIESGDTSVDTTFTSIMNTPQTTGANVYVDGSLGETFTNRIPGLLDSNITNAHTTYVSAGKYWELVGNVESNVTIEANTFLSGDAPHSISMWFNSSNLEANVSNSCIFSLNSGEEKLEHMGSFSSNTYQTVQKILASDRHGDDRFGGNEGGIAVNSDGTKFIVGAFLEDAGTKQQAGSAYIYSYDGSSWNEHKLMAPDKEFSDQFGVSVGMNSDGTKVIVGAFQEDAGGVTDAGAAYIFTYSNGSWDTGTKIVASDKEATDKFGYSAAMSGDGNRVIVGAYIEDHDANGQNYLGSAGSAYIFTYSGSSWDTGTKIVASDRAADDIFGRSVAMNSDGTKVIVGADGGEAAYIFTYNGSSWAQQQILVGSGAVASAKFGFDVAMNSDGTKVVVGAYLDNPSSVANAGSAFIFTYNGSSWDTGTQILAPDKGGGDRFGISVDMSSNGNKVVVGAYLENGGSDDPHHPTDLTDTGSAYIYSYNGSSWDTGLKITSPVTKETNGRFGRSIGMSSDETKVVVGAQLEDPDKLSSAGAVYVFTRDTIHPLVSDLKLQPNTWHNLTYAYQGEGGSRVTYLDGRKVTEDQAEDTFGAYPPFDMNGYSQGGYVVSMSDDYTSDSNNIRRAYELYSSGSTANEGWMTEFSTFNPNAVGGDTFTDSDGGTHTGHFNKLKLPYKLKPSYFYYNHYGIFNSSRNANNWVILGSNNDSDWDLLHSSTTVLNATKHIPITTTKGYTYLMFLCKSVNADTALFMGEIRYYGHRENDLVRLPDPTNVLKYPHIAMTGLAQRGYVVSASSQFSHYNPWEAFDENNPVGGNTGAGAGWAASGPSSTADTYVGATGLDVGTTSHHSGSVTGEWIQIELPHSILLSSIDIESRSETTYGGDHGYPKDVVLYGSLNGSSWSTVKDFTTANKTGSAKHTEAITSSTAYKYYALVVESIHISTSTQVTWTSIGQIRLFGTGVDSIPIQIGGGNIDKVANFRVYDKFIGEDQALEIWDAQKDEFGRAKSSMTLQKGRLGLGTTEPEGRLAVLDEPEPDLYGLQEFPPKPLLGYKTYIEDHGEFCVSGSPKAYYSETSTNYSMYHLFNKEFYKGASNFQSTTWNTLGGAFTASTGLAAHGDKLGRFSGVWVQLELPYKIKLKEFTLSCRHAWYEYAPTDFVVVAYDEDIGDWVELGNYIGEQWNTTGDMEDIKTKSINSTSYYRRYALVVSRIFNPNNNRGDANASDWRLFGYREQVTKQSVLHDGQLTLTKNLVVSQIGAALDADNTPHRDRLVVEYNTSTNPVMLNGSVRDTSGRGNHGLLIDGASYGDGVSTQTTDDGDRALYFNGSSNRLMVDLGGQVFKNSSAHTMSLWVRMNEHSSDFQMFYSLGNGVGNPDGNLKHVNLYHSSNHGLRLSFTQHDYRLGEVVPVGEWVHVAYTYDGTGWQNDTVLTHVNVYVNGKNVGAMDSVYQISANSGALDLTQALLGLGASTKEIGSNSHQFCDCNISNFKLYNTVLTADEVKTLYNMGRCDEGHHLVNFSKTRVAIGLEDGTTGSGAYGGSSGTPSSLTIRGNQEIKGDIILQGAPNSELIFNQGSTSKWKIRHNGATGAYSQLHFKHWYYSGGAYQWNDGGYLAWNGTAQMNFTGQHKTFIKDVPFSQADGLYGLIVSSDQNKYIKMSDGIEAGSNAITTNESLPVVSLSNVVTDKKCFGVISASEDPENRTEQYGAWGTHFEKEKGDTRVYINSVGEGAIWVVNTNGSLEAGDYITTSNVAGYGQKQDDDILHNYSVAKITMDCDFEPATQPIQQILRSNVVETYYLGNVHHVKSVPHEFVTTTATADDAWTNVSISPSNVTYYEWTKLEANTQNTYTLTYTQTSNVVYDTKYTLTTTADVTESDSWDQVYIDPPTVTYAEYSNLEANTQNTYTLTFTQTTTDEKTPEEWSALESNTQSLYNKVYYQSVEDEVSADYPGAVAHTRVTDRIENELDAHGQIQWENHPTETEKAYKLRYLTADGTQTDEANAVHIAAFVGCTYHCG